MNKNEIFSYLKQHANGTVLSFPERGPWGSSSYRGNFSGWIPAAIIYRYGAESVSEIFAGGGTTSDLCKDLKIPYCGIDLNPDPVRSNILTMDILDEKNELPDAFYEADLQMLHPPYPCINHLHYSNSMWMDTKNMASHDIQEMSWEKGMLSVNRAILRGYAAMPAGSYQAVVVGDIRRKVNGKSIFKSMLSELAIPGEMVQILVKIQHNTMSGRTGNYANQKNAFFMIEHEYVVVIKKPSGYEIAYLLPQNHSCDIRDSTTATWKDVVMTVVRELGKEVGKEVSNETIYNALQNHSKCKKNKNYEAKIRQTLQKLAASGVLSHTGRGTWKIAA